MVSTQKSIKKACEIGLSVFTSRTDKHVVFLEEKKKP